LIRGALPIATHQFISAVVAVYAAVTDPLLIDAAAVGAPEGILRAVAAYVDTPAKTHGTGGTVGVVETHLSCVTSLTVFTIDIGDTYGFAPISDPKLPFGTGLFAGPLIIQFDASAGGGACVSVGHAVYTAHRFYVAGAIAILEDAATSAGVIEAKSIATVESQWLTRRAVSRLISDARVFRVGTDAITGGTAGRGRLIATITGRVTLDFGAFGFGPAHGHHATGNDASHGQPAGTHFTAHGTPTAQCTARRLAARTHHACGGAASGGHHPRRILAT